MTASRLSTSMVRAVATMGAAVLLIGISADASADRPSDRASQQCVRTVAAGTHTVDVTFRGDSFPVSVHVPAGVGKRKALPLVLDLHGSQSNGVFQAAISGLSEVADREKFIVARPSGAIPLAQPTPPLPDGSWAWNVPRVPTTAGQLPPADARDDVKYLTAVIDQLDSDLCVNDDRVYADGFSGGARMASALACARPDKIAAIAPVSGLRAGRPSPIDTSVPELQSCAPKRPVAVITFHGDADFVNPYQGNGDLRWGYTVPLAVQSWARINDCRVGPESQQITEHVTQFRYRDCRRGANVVFYKVTGGGHTWPGTAVDQSPLGFTTQEIDASKLMWSFFEAHPRR